MYKFEGRTEENINERIKEIQDEINDVFNNMGTNDNDVCEIDNEASHVNVGEIRNNNVLLKTKRTKHKKRQVNKHFLNFSENPNTKITDEDAKTMINDNVIVIDVEKGTQI